MNKEKTAIQLRYRRDLWQLFIDVPHEQLGGVVEVGVAEGNFAEDICKMPIMWPNIYLVDRWKHMPRIRGDSGNPQTWHDMNLAKVKTRTSQYAQRVHILQGESEAAAAHVPDASLSLVYVDADHSYAGVKTDLLNWYPKLKPGGYMAFHDYQQAAYGVKKAVHEFATANLLTVLELCEDKSEDAGAYFQKK
jgi:hypothetical protein